MTHDLRQVAASAVASAVFDAVKQIFAEVCADEGDFGERASAARVSERMEEVDATACIMLAQIEAMAEVAP